MQGVVAAGNRMSAEAGAEVLRAGGNAVDAAVAAVLTSFVAESVLTGPGAGGFMLVHTAAGERVLLDFFVVAPGLGPDRGEPATLVPVDVHFTESIVQEFHVGVASCGAYGTTAGLAHALDRFGSASLADLTPGPVELARGGVEINPMQEYLFAILGPLLSTTPEAAALYQPDGRPLRAGERLLQPELGDLIARLGEEGPGFLYCGDVAGAVSDWVGERGGQLACADLEAYRVIERVPVCVGYRGREVLTNPPPSSGGVLIAHALGLLERMPHTGIEALVEVMSATEAVRAGDFAEALHDERLAADLLAAEALDAGATQLASRLGSTTHISVIDGAGGAASVTCSNGSSSGVVVPGTGLHLNNMLGEADLNPAGWHSHPPGRRIPSMMAPTIVLRDGAPEAVLGSAGSNRIRSAILQTVIGVVDAGLGASEAVDRDRIHFEAGAVDAEPGIDPDALRRVERAGFTVRRWSERNLFFGGVQAAVRDDDGSFSGAGDPRRGGSAVVV